MDCVSSALLSYDNDLSQIGSSGFAHIIHHLQPPHSRPNPTPTAFHQFPPPPLRPKPDVINSWELMAGLLNYSKDNSDPNLPLLSPSAPSSTNRHLSLDGFERICPPNGEDKVVIYTTTLRGIRKTFEACVRSAVEGLRVGFSEKDISMDRGFGEELRLLLMGKGEEELIPPRVFIKGRHIGGAEEVFRMDEEENGGALGSLLRELPRLRAGHVCEGCGCFRFLPCFRCNGSCKMVEKDKVVRCSDCNENGLVLCPICS